MSAKRIVIPFLLLLLLLACAYWLLPQRETAESWLQNESPDDELVRYALEPWFGDLDGINERRVLRVLVAFNRTNYFLDKGDTRGIAWEMGKRYEDELNRQFKKKGQRLQVVFVPTTRDRLLPWLQEGRGDIAIANLTVTPERLQQADFSSPFIDDASEVLVTAPGLPDINTLDDLAGKDVAVRESSSYFGSLQKLNTRFSDRDLSAVNILPVDEHLEDDDILEMMHAGVYPAAIVDLHVARLWVQVFPELVLHENIAISSGNHIAWAVRKKTPQLLASVNEFMQAHRTGTAFGNDLVQRYYGNPNWVGDIKKPDVRDRYSKTVALFEQYAQLYGFNALLILAQAYQESGLDQSARNPSGAVGVMQILPSTAEAEPVGIKHVELLDNNIHAGVKYLRFLTDNYFDNPDISELDRHLFAFAAYNAGPNRVRRLRELTEKQGLNPNRWFQNVEVMAAKKIGAETTQYVGNIFKYYVSYRRMDEASSIREQLKQDAKQSVTGTPAP